MRRPFRGFPSLALLSCAVLACNDGTSPTAAATNLHGLSQAVSSGEAGTDVIRGRVVSGAAGDSAQMASIAGAVVVVIQARKLVAPGSSDTTTVDWERKAIGELVTDADGAFQLTSVRSGTYFLQTTPPASSGYEPGTSQTISFPAGSTAEALVYLYPRSAPPR